MLSNLRASGRLVWLIFFAAVATSAAMSATVYSAENAARRGKFERTADEALFRIMQRIEQHFTLLKASRALLIVARDKIDAPAFADFVRYLDIANEFPGIQGIGFARLVPAGDTKKIEQELMAGYGISRAVFPATTEPVRTPIVFLEPQNARNNAALGFDMYSDPARRAAILRAIETGEPEASAPVRLKQEITADQQMGFLTYLAVPYGDEASTARSPDTPPSGFVYAPFRAGDLHAAALASSTEAALGIRVEDMDAAGAVLFESGATGPDLLQTERSTEVAGRTWRYTLIESPSAASGPTHLASYFLGLVSLFVAGAAVSVVLANQRRAEVAAAVADANSRLVDERTLILQEMKHRLKNHIARIQAVARHTLRGSTSLEEFGKTFSARLQAMSNAQDLLAADPTLSAGIREVIVAELRQTCSEERLKEILGGPEIRLDARQTHAFSLIVHELATNAMKYGALSHGRADLLIRWERLGTPDGAEVRLLWSEAATGLSEEPARSGFGSRLIDASATGDLDGRISRSFESGRLEIKLAFPERRPATMP